MVGEDVFTPEAVVVTAPAGNGASWAHSVEATLSCVPFYPVGQAPPGYADVGTCIGG